MSRDATAADFRAFFGRLPPSAVRAKVLDVDGEVVGIAGYYVTPRAIVVFSGASPGIPKLRIWREALRFMADLKLPAICFCQSPDAARFLERLGWHNAGEEVFTWQP